MLFYYEFYSYSENSISLNLEIFWGNDFVTRLLQGI